MIHGWQSVMGRKVVGVVLSGVVAMVAVVTSAQLLDVVWCSAVAGVVVVQRSCSCCSCNVV